MQKISLQKALNYQHDAYVESIHKYAKSKIGFYDNLIDKLIHNGSLRHRNYLENLQNNSCASYTSFYEKITQRQIKKKDNESHPIQTDESCKIYETQLNKVASYYSKYSHIQFTTRYDNFSKSCHVEADVYDGCY